VPAGSAGDLDSGSTMTATGEENGDDRIRVLAGNVNRTGAWWNFGVPWFVDGDIELGGPPGTTLTIAGSNELQFGADRYVRVGFNQYGTLIANPGVTFTSAATSKAQGDWRGLEFDTYDQGSTLTSVTVEYGGGNHPGNIYFNGGDGTVVDSTIQHSASFGIFCDAIPVLTNNSYLNNVSGDKNANCPVE
jgi:hypothetical protein